MQPAPASTPPRSLFRRGASVAGLLALAYMTLYLLPIVAAWLLSRPSWELLTLVGGFYLFGSILGLLPAMVLGGLTATALARVLYVLRRRLTAGRAILLGMLMALLGAAIVSALYWVVVARMRGSIWGNGYMAYIGLPSLLYLLAGGWMGLRLFHDLGRAER